MPSGIYTITAPSGSQYVGSAVNLAARWRQHRHELNRGRHFNRGLQRAYKKYGLERLQFEPLLVCRREDLIYFEQRAIDRLKPRYNACQVAGSQLGRNHTAAAKEKNAAAHRGKVFSAEHGKWIPAAYPRKTKSAAALRGGKHIDSFEVTLTTERKEALVADYTGGASFTGLTEKYRADHRVLRRILISEGVEIRPRGRTIKRQSRSLSAEEITRRQDARRRNAETRGYWTSPSARESIKRALSGRKKSPESIARRTATRAANRTMRQQDGS